MGGKFSHVYYREQDAAILPHLLLLTQVWGLDEISLLSVRLRKLSFNFCLSVEQFGDWLALRQNALFRTLLIKWFDTFKNTKTSTVVNGLEILSALAIASVDGKLADKVGRVFDVFDFDESGAITLDELCILLKSVIRGLSKATKGLGVRFVSICAMPEVTELARQCFKFCDLDEEQDLSRELFVQWAKQTPKVINLMRCFVQKDYISHEEAAVVIQRCMRGMHGRKVAAERRLEQQLELDQEITHAAQKIQEAMVSRKKKRDNMRMMKIEKFSHHGALYSFGSNDRAHLGHPHMDLSKTLTTPLLAPFFKNSELRVVSACLSTVHASAVTSNGQVYTWGSGVPGSFGFIPKPSIAVSENWEASGASITNASNTTTVRRVPTRVEDLEDVTIVQSSLGSHHSVALSDAGVLFTWGSGGYGQLGHGDFTESGSEIYKRQFDHHTGREYPYVDLPLQLDKSFFEEMRVLQVACGYYFTVALCEDGSVFTWGEGSDGQLGLGYSDNFQVGFLDEHIHGSSFVYMHTPTRVDELKDPMGSIAVGGNHVYAVSRDHKKVFEWGAWNRRLGDAKEGSFSPELNEELSKLYVDRIATGTEHSLAITARVKFCVSIERQISARTINNESKSEPVSIKTRALCARFGIQPASLTRSISGEMFSLPQALATMSTPTSSLLTSAVYERTDAHIRACLSGCLGKVTYIDRGTTTGHWISLTSANSAQSTVIVDIPCVPGTFGPEITDNGLASRVFYSPQKLRSLRLYVRPDEIVKKIVVLEFSQDDIVFDDENMELSEMIQMIMISLIERVKDAQETGAAAVIVLFDFLEADPFALEPCEDDDYEFLIPAVMVRKSLHGDLLLQHLTSVAKPIVVLSHREDILGKQIQAAQKLGAKAVVVGQNRIDPEPTRLPQSVLGTGEGGSDSLTPVVKIPVLSVSYDDGEAIKHCMKGLDGRVVLGQVGLGALGDLYAWGYGQNGRLGLGDIENEQIFEAGFDGARQVTYQFVPFPELVTSLFHKQVSFVSCGDEHSAAVTADGQLYCWGSGRFGKLGNGVEEDEDTPYMVEALASVSVSSVTCGSKSTFAVTEIPSTSKQGQKKSLSACP